MTFTPHTQTNPYANARPPFALRYSANRPAGEFQTIADAVAACKPGGGAVVTATGWWLVGRIA